MKVVGEFTENSHCLPLEVQGTAYRAIWEADPGYVEVPGVTEYRVEIDDDRGQAAVFMRWLVADLDGVGGKEGLLDALESHSQEGADWAACLRAHCECQDKYGAGDAIALLSLIADAPDFKGRGAGTKLARAFADAVLAPRGVRAMWIKPVPLREDAATGVFKPVGDAASSGYAHAQAHLERHYERSLDASWTCPDYLSVELGADGDK